MNGPGTPSLDQLKVFLVVAETGSFAAAGRQLGRATSAISYAIANLERQLGLALFDRESTRKPILTEAGTAILTEACLVNSGIDHLRAKVKGLLSGLEAELSLAVDIMLPTTRLVDAMRAFEIEFPTVTLRLHVEALGAVTQLVREGMAGIGISGPLSMRVPDIEQIEIGDVELIPVAAPTHALAQKAPNAPGAARRYVQLVLSDRSTLTEGHDYGVIGVRTWRLADLSTKHALLLAGIGWGNMPEPMVHDDLAAGRLHHINIPELSHHIYRFQAIHRTDTPPGPAAAWLIKRFAGQRA
jgi:DNA-binding transcriptional LysR family regulator